MSLTEFKLEKEYAKELEVVRCNVCSLYRMTRNNVSRELEYVEFLCKHNLIKSRTSTYKAFNIGYYEFCDGGSKKKFIPKKFCIRENVSGFYLLEYLITSGE